MSDELRSMADNSDQPESNVASWVRRGAEEIDSFADRLDHDGIEVTSAEVRRPTLDDVFLALTGHHTHEPRTEPPAPRGDRLR